MFEWCICQGKGSIPGENFFFINSFTLIAIKNRGTCPGWLFTSRCSTKSLPRISLRLSFQLTDPNQFKQSSRISSTFFFKNFCQLGAISHLWIHVNRPTDFVRDNVCFRWKKHLYLKNEFDFLHKHFLIFV